MKKTFYKRIEGESEEVGDKIKFLKIEVAYSLGGMNFFDGKQNRRGLYVHFNHVEKENRGGYFSESFMPFDECNFKIMAVVLKRKSEKKSEQLHVALAKIEKQLFDLYEQMNKNELLKLVQGINLN